MSVAVVSENMVFAEVLASVCSSRGMKVVGVFASCDMINWLHPDEVVLVHLPTDDPCMVREIRSLVDRFSVFRIILLASDRVSEQTLRTLEPLVSAVLPESEPSSGLLSAIVLGELGYRVMPHATRPAPDVAAVSPPPEPEPADQSATSVSRREATILLMLHDGLSNKGIANQLGISDTTVKVHLRAAYRKIGVNNRTQAAMWAVRHLQPRPARIDRLASAPSV